MQHAVLYQRVAAGAEDFANATIVPFGMDTVLNNVFGPTQDMDILGVQTGGAQLTAARIQTPLLNQTASLHVRPFNAAALGGNNLNFSRFFDNPVKIRAVEPVALQVSQGAAGTVRSIIVFGDKNYSKVSGQRIRIRATSTTTVTAGAWTQCTLIPDESLPFRLFHIVGLEIVSATGVLGRLSIPGMPYNPGVPVLQAIGSRMDDFWYEQFAGSLGRFSNQAFPSLQIFCTAADTSAQVFMDIIPA